MIKILIQLFKKIKFLLQKTIQEQRLCLNWANYDFVSNSNRVKTQKTISLGPISWLLIIKELFLIFIFNFFKLSLKGYFLLILNLLAFTIICKNLYDTFDDFYFAFNLKKEFLALAGASEAEWFSSKVFAAPLLDLYIIHEIQLLLAAFIWKLLFGVLMIVPVLLIIAYSTLLERKILSAAQRWRGPNKVGIKGSTQPLIDGVKLILKEIIIPVQSESRIFVLSSIWSIFFMLLLWFIIPTSKYGNIIQFNYELLALFCVSILGSISILLAGWSSNSKYAFLGGVRAGAQMISYDLVLGLIVLIVMTVTSTTQIIDIVEFQDEHGPLFLYLPAETGLFLILIVAETNRAPFDFAEAESELVSGYNTEYSGLPFAFFFIAEYGNILYMSLLTSLLFFGGWSTNFLPLDFQDNFYLESLILFSKTILVYFFFLWLRAALPRYRYDQLMSLCWKVFLPLVLISLVLRILTFINLN